MSVTKQFIYSKASHFTLEFLSAQEVCRPEQTLTVIIHHNVCMSFRMIILNKITNIHETRYRHHATKGHPVVILSNFLTLITPPYLLCELVRWDSQLPPARKIEKREGKRHFGAKKNADSKILKKKHLKDDDMKRIQLA